jgi:hypothetical protein
MLDAFGSRKNDNSVKINQYTDSFNSTSSWNQALENIGSTNVTVGQPGGIVEALTPILIVGLLVVGIIAVFRRT